MLYTLGLSPALQRVMLFETLARGQVNRAVRTVWCPAGKAINAARAARIFAGALPIAVVGPQAGPTGQICRAGIASARLIDRTADTQGETRVCTTVIEKATGVVTELVEEPPALTTNELQRLLDALGDFSTLGDVGTLGAVDTLNTLDTPNTLSARNALLLCAGTLSPGAPADFYAQAARRLPTAPLIVDARGPALMLALGAPSRNFRIARLNREEALSTTAQPDLSSALRVLHTAGATHVVLTDSAELVYASSETGVLTFRPPRVNPLNTTGCGDCLTGVLAAALLAGLSFHDAVHAGVCASAASAETLLPADFDPNRADGLRALP